MNVAFATTLDKYFVTVCDTEHYNWAIDQIECIHKYNSNVKEIAVYDLALTDVQRKHLTTLPKVVVRDIEQRNKYMRDQFVVRPNGRISRGWYTWKAVAVHDATKRYPYFLYMDAGVRPNTDLTPIFQHLIENRHFFITTGHNMRVATTTRQIKQLNVTEKELDEESIQTNVMGITPDLMDTFVKPAYETTTDFDLYVDDGTSEGGFGRARYDQTIFGIFQIKAKLPLIDREGGHLKINKEHIPFRSHYFFRFKPV